VKTDVDAAGHVRRGKLGRVACVEQLSAIANRRGDLFHGQRLQFTGQCLIERRPLAAVQHRIVREVRGRIGLVRGDKFDEALLRHRLQRVIEHSLLADGGGGFLRDGFTAQRSGAVRRIHLRRIGKLQQLVVQRVVEHPSQLGCGPSERRAEIRPSHVSDKQRVASEYGDGIGDRRSWIRARASVVYDERNRLDCVARRLQNFDANGSKIDHRAVAHRFEPVFGNGFSSQTDGRANAVAQLEVARNEVGVKMRQEHINNAQVVLRCECQILIDVTLRVDNGRDTTLLVGNDVGGVREAVQVELLENHVTMMPQALLE